MEDDQDFVISFYGTSDASDSNARTLNDILRFTNTHLEYYHDYIQLLFPLPEPSPFNLDAPLVTPRVRAAFLTHRGLRERLLLAVECMLQFYGFGLNPSYTHTQIADLIEAPRSPGCHSEIIGRGPNFGRRAQMSWLKEIDHNHLRLTRIIRSLRVLGLEVVAVELWKALLREDENGVVSARTKVFWKRAATRALWLPPSEGNEGAVGVRWLREEAEMMNVEKDAEKDVAEGRAGGIAEKSVEAQKSVDV